MNKMTITEFQNEFEKGNLESELYTAKVDDKEVVLMIGPDGFSYAISTHHGWYRIMIYELIDGEWYITESYKKEQGGKK